MLEAAAAMRYAVLHGPMCVAAWLRDGRADSPTGPEGKPKAPSRGGLGALGEVAYSVARADATSVMLLNQVYVAVLVVGGVEVLVASPASTQVLSYKWPEPV